MKYRKLGSTGYDVSTIGFGLWQLGGERWSSPNEIESIELLNKARKIGINIYDSAVVYGQYSDQRNYLQCRSQELLGKAFFNYREQVVYCIKLGQYDEFSHFSNYSPERLVDQFQHSLRRLQTDFIDIVLIHAPSLNDIQSKNPITVLQTLKAQGLVRAIGYSFENDPEHALLAAQQNIDVVMLQYNLLHTECEKAIEELRQQGLGILVGGAFYRGYLTGCYESIDDFPLEDDYWRWNINHCPGKVKQFLERTNQLKQEYGSAKKLRQAALQFSLNNPAVASAMIGHRHYHEIEENIKIGTQ